jgi:hypothetical protein
LGERTFLAKEKENSNAETLLRNCDNLTG